MSEASSAPARNSGVRTVVIGAAVGLGVVAVAGFGNYGRFAAYVATLHPHLHAPDRALLAAAEPQVKIHLAAAVLALVIGTVQMLGAKGATAHRVLGWTWVVAMVVAAVSSLFIHHLHPGHFSFIHALSAWTLIAAPMLIYRARHHDVKSHRRVAMGLFYGGLLVAGLLAFLPGRLLWGVFFG